MRVTGRIVEPRQFGDVIVTTRGGPAGARARTWRAWRTPPRTSGRWRWSTAVRAIGIDIIKVSGANTVDVADGVKKALAALTGELPSGTAARIVRDNSVVIRNSVTDVVQTLILGALLTVLIVMLFLNDWKATAITALSLPVSVISAFVLMGALGFTLNIITLMALSLSIGILIDDAIVVVENIVRHRELGEERFAAAGNGTREIILAVMATTFSIVAVFVPVAFMGGIIGRFFYAFGLTVAWAVLVSLFVSFTLTPMLSAWWGVRPHRGHEGEGGWFTRALERFNVWFDRLARRYRAVIRLGARAPADRPSLVAVVSFVGALALFPFIGGAFQPDSDNSEFAVQFETPEGTNLSYTRVKAEQVGATLRGRSTGVSYTYTTIGAGATGTVRTGEIYVKLTGEKERKQSQQELMVVARERLKPIYGVKVVRAASRAASAGRRRRWRSRSVAPTSTNCSVSRSRCAAEVARNSGNRGREVVARRPEAGTARRGGPRRRQPGGARHRPDRGDHPAVLRRRGRDAVGGPERRGARRARAGGARAAPFDRRRRRAPGAHGEGGARPA